MRTAVPLFRVHILFLSNLTCFFLTQQVIPGSAADQGSGLQPGDLIVAVNGIHISEWDEDKLLEAFRGEDIIGSKCRLTIERPEAKHLGPVDVEVLRTNASFAKEVELLFLLGQLPFLILFLITISKRLKHVKENRVVHSRCCSNSNILKFI